MCNKGDFHIHSRNSDGDLTPEEIVLLAKKRNVDIIALTDHNTVSGNEEAILVGQIHNIKVIPGIELSTRYKGNKVHILGYFTDDIYKNNEFISVLDNIYKGRFKFLKSYFKGKFNVKQDGKKISTKSGVDFLHYYNAKVVLAHPTLLNRAVFKELINLNFDGIEAKYYRNKEGENDYFISIAKAKGLIYTAGSDFHYLNKVDLKHGTLGDTYLENNEIEDFLDMLS